MYDSGIVSVDNITRREMSEFADHLEEYLELYLDCMVMPNDMPKRDKKMIKWAIHKVKELIKKLRKGDIEVFDDYEGFSHNNEKPF